MFRELRKRKSYNLRKLEQKRLELLKRIELTKKHKQHILDIVHTLLSEYKERKITHFEYEEKLSESLGDKSAKEWLDYYDNYIKTCENHLILHEKKISKDRWKSLGVKCAQIASVLVIFSLLFLFVYFYGAGITGFFLLGNVTEERIEYSENLNLVFNESRTYEWAPSNPGTIAEIRISGRIEGKGEIKILFEDKIIFESSSLDDLEDNLTEND